MNDTITLNKHAWLSQHAAVFGNHVWPDGSVLMLASAVNGAGGYRAIGSAPANDAEAAWRVIEPYAARGLSTYVTIAPRTSRPESGMGKKADVGLISALVVDLDVNSGEHAAGDKNPTEEQVLAWLAEGPAPTVLVRTGGGFHAWWSLYHWVDPTSVDGAELLARHKAYWLGLGVRDGVNVDAGPIANVAGVLRPAGTWNWKQNGATTLATPIGRAYSTVELLKQYPEIAAPLASRAPSAANSGTSSLTRTGTRVFDLARIGDRFAVNVPVTELAQQLFNVDADAQGGLIFPRADGSYAEDGNTRVYSAALGGDPEMMTIFGSRVQAAFGITSMHSWSSFDLLANTLGKNYKAAAQMLGRFEVEGQWYDDFFDAARAVMPQELASEFGIEGPVPVTTVLTVPVVPVIVEADVPVIRTAAGVNPIAIDSSPVDSAPPFDPYAEDDDNDDVALASLLIAPVSALASEVSFTIATAIAGRQPGEFQMEGKIAHVWNGDLHGIYRRVKDENGLWTNKRLTRWVLFKSREVERRTVGTDGIELGSRETAVTLTIATSDGRVKTMPGFSVAEAHNLKSAIDTLNFGVEVPESDAALKAVANSVRILGATDGGTVRVSEYGSTGWLRAENGEWAYLAPAGSVTAVGATDRFTVGAPAGSDEGALTDAQRQYGWQSLPVTAAEIREAAAAIPAFLALSPNPKSPSAFAVLGAMLAAPLALSSRTTVFLAGLPDSGKSKVAGAAQAFVNGADGVFGTSWTGGSVLKASERGASVVCSSWGRHSIGFWDDYRMPADDMATSSRMRAVVSTILQAAYGGADSGQKSTKTGGLMSMKSSEYTAVVTGEALPEESGILSRAVSVTIAKGDVALTPMGSSPLDRFRSAHAAGAHGIYGRYLQWLAARLESLGSLAAFRAENAAIRATVTPADGRSAEAVSVLAVGWARLIQCANELGFRDLLPSDEEITVIVADLAGTNSSLVNSSNPAHGIIRALRDAVAGSAGSIDLHDDTTPVRRVALRLGWAWRQSQPSGEGVYERNRFTVGTLTQDKKWVLLSSNAVAEIKKRSGYGSLPQGQLLGGFTSIVMAGTEAGGRSPRSLGLNRARGYVIAASLMDLGDLADADAPNVTNGPNL